MNDEKVVKADKSQLTKSEDTTEATWHRSHVQENADGGAALYQYAFFSEKLLGYFERERITLRDLGFHSANAKFTDWRMRERLKTVSVALLLCLNIGIDPPDVVKTSPCAKLEGWVDPFSLPPQKALETIGRNLQTQYEVWQPRARYRLSLDPTVDETRKLCGALRRNAKEERILFHYNGHGVPKPTVGGEIWVFNKNYTQYIPLSIYDVQAWLGSPCIFVYDCSAAGNVVNAFNKFAEQRDRETMRPDNSFPHGYTPISQCIQLAACGANETLPMNPDLPADVFSCCLTTPIEIALRWFVSQNAWLSHVSHDDIMKIPGRLNDRRTPLGELNWIFTAITDTIAWNALPHDQFKKLFRQDLMVAALFRNFLLAERILRFYQCTPISSPPLPPTHNHSMWAAWDLAADMCLSQLPDLLSNGETEYQHSTFFAEQLTAFEVWLSKGYVTRSAPEQLPIVLQVLLSQVHRLRALMLLSKFLDLGPWAVNLALSVGIFPYVLKLLQSPAAELKPVLVFIWAKLLAVDNSCQNDLLKDNGFTYFVQILVSDAGLPPIVNLSEHRAMCAFILAVFVSNNFQAGKEAALKTGLFNGLIAHLVDPDPLLRQWSCLCLGAWWDGVAADKKATMQDAALSAIVQLQHDPVSDVRASSLFALSTLVKPPCEKQDEQVLMVALGSLHLLHDGSPLVRKELVCFLSVVIAESSSKFVTVAFELLDEERKRLAMTAAAKLRPSSAALDMRLKVSTDQKKPLSVNKSSSSGFMTIWKALLVLTTDAVADVAVAAEHVVDSVQWKMLHSSLYKTSLQIDKEKPGFAIDSAQDEMSNTHNDESLDAIALGSPLPSVNQLLSSTKSVASFISNAAASPVSVAKPTFAESPEVTAESPASFDNSNSAGGSKKRSTLLKKSQSFYFESIKPLFASVAANGSSASLATDLNNLAASESLAAADVPSPVYEFDMTRHEKLRKRIDPNVPLEEHFKLPLDSELLRWMSEYFAEPQMKIPDQENPGSQQYNLRDARRKSIGKYLARLLPAQPVSGFRAFEHFQQVEWPSSDALDALCFEQFEPLFVVAHRSRWLSLYSYKTGKSSRLFSWDNGNSGGSRVESLRVINEEDGPKLIASGSSDGVVRLWNADSGKESKTAPVLVSSWKCFTSLYPEQESRAMPPRLLLEWQQASGTLASSCVGQKCVKLWDLEKEALVYSSGPWAFVDGRISAMYLERDILQRSTMLYEQDLLHNAVGDLYGLYPTGSNCEPAVPPKLLAEHKLGLNIVYLGLSTGQIALIDRRMPSTGQQGVLSLFLEHSSPILDIQWQRGLGNLLVSCCSDGLAKFWDVRQPGSSLKTAALTARSRSKEPKRLQNLLAVSCHEMAPLISCASSKYFYIFNTDGVLLSSFKNYHSNPIVQFHRHDLLLGTSYYNPFTSFQGFQLLSSEARNSLKIL